MYKLNPWPIPPTIGHIGNIKNRPCISIIYKISFNCYTTICNYMFMPIFTHLISKYSILVECPSFTPLAFSMLIICNNNIK